MPLSESLLDGLNETQRAAVCSPNTPLCILAGAGTGKTRVLTRRIAYQATCGNIAAKHTLALTFTRKAARELRERLHVLGMQSSVSAGTFHSAAYAQLKIRWAEQNKRLPQLLTDKRGLINRVAHKAGIRLAKPEVQEAVTELEWAKARRIAPDDYPFMVGVLARTTPLEPSLLSRLLASYEAEKTKRGLLDFDDLLVLALCELEENPDYAEARRWKFQHLFVDEMQDVNRLQFDLLRAWLGERNDLCAVGDPNQAIYTWNGADSGYIQNFQDWFVDADLKMLKDNYRSTPQILTAGHAVLGKQAALLYAHCPDGPTPKITAHANDADEATCIAQALVAAKDTGTAWSAMAVLIRTNAQTTRIVAALNHKQIPFRLQADKEQSQNQPQNHNEVTVSTFHAAKGLEWPIVHLAGIEQGFVPIAQAQSTAELLEERRLLYVAITRAQQELHFHWAAERCFGNKTVKRAPSPYLRAILSATQP